MENRYLAILRENISLSVLRVSNEPLSSWGEWAVNMVRDVNYLVLSVITEGTYFSIFLVSADIHGILQMNSSKLFKQRCERRDHVEFQERESEFSSPGFADDPLSIVSHRSPSGC